MKIRNQFFLSILLLALSLPLHLMAGDGETNQMDMENAGEPEVLAQDEPQIETPLVFEARVDDGSDLEQNSGRIETQSYGFGATRLDRLDFLYFEGHFLDIDLGYRYDKIDLFGFEDLRSGSHEIHNAILGIQGGWLISEKWSLLTHADVNYTGFSGISVLDVDGGFLAARSAFSAGQFLIGAEYDRNFDAVIPTLGFGWGGERIEWRISTSDSYIDFNLTDRIGLHLRAYPGGNRWHFREEHEGEIKDIDLSYRALSTEAGISFQVIEGMNFEFGIGADLAKDYEGRANDALFLDRDSKDETIFGFARLKLEF